jgi:TRAP-type C4-dicarboxylate transport system permease small subunit
LSPRPQAEQSSILGAADRARAALRRFCGVLVLAAIAIMGMSVFLRYVMLPITEKLDLDPISFFWVEEAGELALAWTALVGAAVGIAERTHFALALFTQHLPARAQYAIHALNHLVIAAFGGVIAWQGWIIIGLNRGLTTPALEISMAWLFTSLVAGGILICLFALAMLADQPRPSQHSVE